MLAKDIDFATPRPNSKDKSHLNHSLCCSYTISQYLGNKFSALLREYFIYQTHSFPFSVLSIPFPDSDESSGRYNRKRTPFETFVLGKKKNKVRENCTDSKISARSKLVLSTSDPGKSSHLSEMV